MKEQRVQELPPLQLKPIISYPRIAEAGEQYLLSIDVQLVEGSPWPYQEEEFEISFVLETAPFFTHEPLGEQEPGIVLHRFGGTYGPAEYLLTAAHNPIAPGTIKLALLNGWGLPIAQLKLDCEVKREVRGKKLPKVTIEHKEQSAPMPALVVRESGEAAYSIERPQSSLLQQEKEQKQRESIVKQLSMAGWDVVQNTAPLDQGDTTTEITIPDGIIAFQGYPSIENDYLLIIAHVVVGIVKVHAEGEKIIGELDDKALQQISKEIKMNLGFANFSATLAPPFRHIPFVYRTTGSETTFTNYLEPDHTSRKVYTFHQPETFLPYLGITTKNHYNLLRANLQNMLLLEQGGLYSDQFKALQQIEQSLLNNHLRTLIQMETGTGKTHTLVHYSYRILTQANARHILYIVDNRASKEYVFDSFQRFTVPDGKQKFTDIYQVRMIADEKLDPSVHVYIGLLDDLYVLYAQGREGEHLPPPTFTWSSVKDYCAELPIEYFDVIFLSDCERLNFQMWQPVLNYFDAFFIGIADTLTRDITAFFNQNVVYSTSNVGEEIFTYATSKDDEEIQEEIETYLQRQKQIASTMRVVRNLLRNDAGLSYETDRSSQLVWLLFLKNLDDFEQAQREVVGNSYLPAIEEGYRWRDWVVGDNLTYRRKGDELLTFVSDDLIPYLSRLSGEGPRDIRNIIGTIFQHTTNAIRSGYILREVVDKLNTINFNASDDIHAISVFYETMLKEMHGSAKEAGEFYTPRPLVQFIIDCLQPQLGEVILDPACGTAGFLVETFGRLVDKVRTPEQRKKLQDHLMGVEKKSIPYSLAITNMLLHGIESPHIIQHDVFTIDPQQFQEEDRIDVIVTNPPFGGRIDASPATLYRYREDMQSADISLHFVQFIMQTLKRPGGRCGLMLPNSFLFQKRTTSTIRRRLLTHFHLHTIVRLPAGVFSPYTTIPTNILFFESDQERLYSEANPCTKEVWFYEIPLPEGRRSYTKTRPIPYEAFQPCIEWWDNRIENEHAWKVPIEQILANDCNLDYHNPRNS